MNTGWICSFLSPSKSCWHTNVLPAPVSPVKKTGYKHLTCYSINLEYVTVSLVGTTKSKNDALGSYWNLGKIASHLVNTTSKVSVISG